MIRTYDFILQAKQNEEFRAKIEKAMSDSEDIEICTDMYRMNFMADSQAVLVRALSDSSPWSSKILPKKITYRAVRMMLSGEFDDFNSDDFTDIIV